MKRIIILLLGLFYCFYMGCQSNAKIDIEVEKESVNKFINDFWLSFETKDFEAFSKLVAHDNNIVCFGTDESERWAGWNAMKEAVSQQFKAFHSIDIKTAAVVVNVSETGKTAWFSLIRTIEVTDEKGEKDAMKNRITGVLEKRNGDWKLVQYHSSAALSWERFKY